MDEEDEEFQEEVKEKRVFGRPRKPFDWDLVESLVILEATEEFVASRILAKNNQEENRKSIQSTIKFMQRRIHERFGCTFVEYRDKRVESRRIALRQWQWKAAQNGNATMLIWLGKQYLNQRDKHDIDSEVKVTGEDNKITIELVEAVKKE